MSFAPAAWSPLQLAPFAFLWLSNGPCATTEDEKAEADATSIAGSVARPTSAASVRSAKSRTSLARTVASARSRSKAGKGSSKATLNPLRFSVMRCVDDSGHDEEWEEVYLGTDLSKTFWDLEPGTPYKFRVQVGVG